MGSSQRFAATPELFIHPLLGLLAIQLIEQVVSAAKRKQEEKKEVGAKAAEDDSKNDSDGEYKSAKMASLIKVQVG